MESRVPLPTDSIYKFYALFGLLLLIFGFGSTVYLSKSTNELIFDSAVEIEILKALPERSVGEEARFRILERKVTVAVEDKEAMLTGIAALIVVGAIAMLFGFWKWQFEVQPIQDEIAKFSLQRLKQEVEKNEIA